MTWLALHAEVASMFDDLAWRVDEHQRALEVYMACVAAGRAEYRRINGQRFVAATNRWRAKNVELTRAYSRTSDKRKRERAKTDKAYAEKRRAQRREQNRRYREKHRERERERVRLSKQEQRARKKAERELQRAA